ncbi:hypothetical protein JQX08_17095 [Pseudomonas sp. UL073]|uniref:Phytase-like domain-containing protein n=1 Tax=Zestomonas insulae TaxID=2809017 RepID=A0ABS2IHJ7_9GAMM|nr:hypothetical protein [Pseudomonas insulae]MBM7062432.1 hypothetical protein [Pseudomonas insulae]
MHQQPAPSLTLTHLADLRVSAASALVCADEQLWLVADDALVLQRYQLNGNYAGELTLLPGALPADAAARKARKPDFEALARLPDGALLALGSGSTVQRRRGCLVRGGEVQVIDLGPLYRHLEQAFAELNIEGAVVRGEQLLLAQRGNGAAAQNALVLLDLARVLSDLAAGQLSAAAVQRLIAVPLGELDGVPLGLTDLALDARGRLYCSAAAEASASTYLDGACSGSLLARFDEEFQLVWQARLQPAVKIEGLACHADGHWLLVADADDPQRPASLFRLAADALG